MNPADYGWLVLLTPLIGLGFNIAVGPSVSRRVVAWVASLSILAGFVLSLLAFIDLLSRDDSQRAFVSTGLGMPASLILRASSSSSFGVSSRSPSSFWIAFICSLR